MNQYGISEGKSAPWLIVFESNFLLGYTPTTMMEQVDYEQVRRLFYNSLDVGVKTFLDSFTGRFRGWSKLKLVFLARYGAEFTDAKCMFN